VKLLLDEMLSPVIAARLRERGHDVQTVKGGEHEALSDSDVMDLARSQRRAVVTNDLVDFRRLHHEAIAPGGDGHFAMAFMSGSYRRTKADTGRIVKALERQAPRVPRRA
jgi:hypothetical protein